MQDEGEDLLMELRIPPGWAVCYNRFYDVDPVLNDEGEIENWGCFTQDLLQLARMEVNDAGWCLKETAILIDLGWYPDGEAEGEYALKAVINPGWRTLLDFRSKDRMKIKAELEELLAEDIFIHPFQNSSNPVNLDFEVDRFRTFFSEHYEIPEEDAGICRYENPSALDNS